MDLSQLFPAFRAVVEASPEDCERILAHDLSPDLAEERDALLLETAALYQRWHDLG